MKYVLFINLFFCGHFAFSQDPGFKLIATSQRECDFRDLYEKSYEKCELSLIYEKDAQTVSLFFFKNRVDSSSSYTKFLSDYSKGHLITSFNVADLFPLLEGSDSLSAFFQAGDKIQFVTNDETRTSVRKMVNY